MYKVLLVDDEKLDLESLVRLVPWNEFGMEVAAAVTHAHKALRIMEETDIDIVITDIRMPGMNGIELAESIRSRSDRVAIVFISGYEDFQYARKAIRMNASSYLLKPAGDEELLETLRAVKSRLDRERSSKEWKEELDEALPLARREWMLQWLNGTSDIGLTRRMLDKFGFERSGCPVQAAAIEIDDLFWKWRGWLEERREAALKELAELLGRELERLGLATCPVDGHRLAAVAFGGVSADAMRALVATFRAKTGYTITVGLGPPAERAEELHESYRQALSALSSKLFLGKNRVILPAEGTTEFSRHTVDLDRMFESLFAATARYEVVQIHDLVERLFDYVRSLDDKLTVYNFTLYVFAKLDAYLQTLGGSLQHLIGLEFRQLDELYHFETIDDMKSWLRRKIYEISEHLYIKRHKPGRKVTGDIAAYVEENLAKPLTLREVAGRFHFSPNYLGYIFREETGESFSDFVIRKRLEAARRLLQQSELKIYEVAERVGYKNMTYFSRHFRQHTGLAPGDFRKQSRTQR